MFVIARRETTTLKYHGQSKFSLYGEGTLLTKADQELGAESTLEFYSHAGGRCAFSSLDKV